MVYLAVILGRTIGSLYDPLVWVMIGFAAFAGALQLRWWTPAILVVAFSAAHAVLNPAGVPYTIIPKILIAFGVYAIVRLIIKVCRLLAPDPLTPAQAP